ncbi:MAG: PTS sugar transporter subunit IIA [Gammaproteobacteria bacterium]
MNNLISSILTPSRCFIDIESQSKKAVIERASILLATDITSSNHRDIFQQLFERERLGSTSIGHGVALPHARIKDLDRPYAAFIRLAQPVEYQSEDKASVDLIFSLVVPEEATQEHLQILAHIAQRFHQETFRNALRQAKDEDELWTLFTNE